MPNVPPGDDGPRKNPRRRTLQVSILDACGNAGLRFDEGQSTFVHRWMLLVELRVVPSVVAMRWLTLFRRERLLGET